MTRELVRLVRPGQWAKNALVAAAPLAAGTLLTPAVAGRTLLALLAFVLASGATYALNDLLDAPADALHPVKRTRPVASGALSRRTAAVVAAVLAVAAMAVALAVGLGVVVATYLLLTAAYSAGLKHEPVVELAVVALGFVLRAVGGGVATDTPLSQWFLIVTGFASLLVVAGKRESELVLAGRDGRTPRQATTRYSLPFLRVVTATSAAMTVAGYSLWAADVSPTGREPWIAVSVVPFTVGVLRFVLDAENADAEEPERTVVRDRVLLGLGVLWLATYGLGMLP
ncbi:decaprenyl-phosphate phosphoribosyltransferase [Phycicoccus flavus]|uniref:Decaprenyl-phosphate phosphoribosyltransferase n=1 Tax=Phycicoccus flavus TaxID=2502783 RepID=A0A8T6QYR5_9MICO|nr:decaprenyl-phosphate phosphoribosyltransferase [Phycicoccus flavus]NHA67239.1 decaprenyl-phosphate phosphoribosyltransferase [Phycicoccus flavus]